MKLITRTILYFIAIALMVFSIGGFIFYHFLRSTTISDADEKLMNEKDKVLNYVKVNREIPHNAIAFGDTVIFDVLDKPFAGMGIKDTNLYNKGEKESEPYRLIEFPVSTDRYYKATILKPLIESDDLNEGIYRSLLIIGGILLLLLIMLDAFIAKKAWAPFYDSLEKLKAFDLIKGEQIAFGESKTTEFKALNDALKNMTVKMSSDYRSLKEFTENASHEIQTPLAVLQSKIELLIQSENLSPEQLLNVKDIYDSATKLSKLNQALLLLTKIENRQFTGNTIIALHQVIEDKLELFKENLEHRKICVEKHIQPITIKADPTLADILVSNLISNAIKHNMDGGKLKIEADHKHLIISNSGEAPHGSTKDFFKRFKKHNQASDSLGLGLAIVSEICTVYRFKIHYEYREGMHTISLTF